VAEVLLAKGADVDAKDGSGQTPLHVASSLETKRVPELLIAKGANVNARDNRGNTPLHLAAPYTLLLVFGTSVKTCWSFL